MNRDAKACGSDRNSYRLIAVSDRRQRDELQRLTTRVLGIEFPNEYVLRANTLAFLDGQDRICGGAMLIVTPPFRSLESIPAESAAAIDWSNKNLSQCAEINGVWVASHLKSPMMTLVFWRLLLRFILECDRLDFLFTFDNSNDRMSSLAQLVKPHVVYSGRTLRLSGMAHESDETIAMIDDQSLLAFVKLLDSQDAGILNRPNVPSPQNESARPVGLSNRRF